MNRETAAHINTLGRFCGQRDVQSLDRSSLYRAYGIACKSIILCQDATMQRRMDAGFRQYRLDGISVINYASYSATAKGHEDGLRIQEKIHGMWDIDRYVNLLMGEIPRLRDDENGYGPAGKGFIAHVDIPQDVENAFSALKKIYGSRVREANP